MDLVALAWLALVLVHVMPAAAAFSPRLRQRMYGVAEDGNLAVILTHRGVLFLAVAAACAYAAFDPASRQLAAIVAGISVLGFLLIYVASGSPKRLRSIALIDLIAVAPLLWAVADAWALA
jgi:hypothetical protein